ncbi:DUF2577 family protein [Paenibacillus elgii]|uniref:DUF2577 family protein n=1 Tax=Paenibacillus elgii TaxID=189691 RepID=UPI0013D14614|nr:DUF2577 family protein [Paenibacillus elgii]
MSAAWLVNFIQEQGAKLNPPSIQLGKVVSIPPNLIIQTGGQPLDREHLLVSEHLLRSQISGTSEGVFEQVTLGMPLGVGDTVAMLPTVDHKVYIVLCKVV